MHTYAIGFDSALIICDKRTKILKKWCQSGTLKSLRATVWCYIDFRNAKWYNIMESD